MFTDAKGPCPQLNVDLSIKIPIVNDRAQVGHRVRIRRLGERRGCSSGGDKANQSHEILGKWLLATSMTGPGVRFRSAQSLS